MICVSEKVGSIDDFVKLFHCTFRALEMVSEFLQYQQMHNSTAVNFTPV